MDPASNHPSTQQHGSAPPSPSMSQSQQGGMSRQPVSYPSPTSYPSPNLSSAQYNYPVPNGQQPQEQYRGSPTGSNSSLSLPSMRSLDPLQQQAQTHHMGSSLPPPGAQMGPYYHGGQTLPHPSQQYPNVTSDPQGMRYALPVPDGRLMSGGRHKKEIKRRTKTGCLTCRKRRIKCDEAHPACRNCQKSKRECMGYDPIFKQQPGPPAIQPAPSSGPSQQSNIPASSNPYGNQPMLQGYGSHTPDMSYEPVLSTSVSSPGSGQGYYSSAIDPALEAAAPAPNPNQFQQPSMSNFRDELKQELQSASPYSSGAETPHIRGGAFPFSPSSSQLTFEDSTTYTNKAKPSSVDDLLVPLAASIPTTSEILPAQLDESKHLFHAIYSPGLENFLETKWFAGQGPERLLANKPLLALFAALLDQFAKTAQDDPIQMTYTANVEARVVWGLACLVREAASEASNGIKTESAELPPPEDALEASHRLTVFENLLCGIVAEINPLTKPNGTGDHHRQREISFWYSLGEFVTLKELGGSGPTTKIDETLTVLRGLLDGRENRDVLYSIAVVRGISNRVAEYSYHDRPLHLDETDQRSKLAVAKQFVKDEGDGHGTTNVIRRLCELATRSWTAPRPTKSS